MAEDPARPAAPRVVRFEAIVDPAAGARAAVAVDDLDIDRVPDPEGRVRAVVDLDACARLIEQGYEVRLLRALPVRPLDPALVVDEDAARAWYQRRVRRG